MRQKEKKEKKMSKPKSLLLHKKGMDIFYKVFIGKKYIGKMTPNAYLNYAWKHPRARAIRIK